MPLWYRLTIIPILIFTLPHTDTLQQSIESTDRTSRWSNYSWFADESRLSRLSWQSWSHAQRRILVSTDHQYSLTRLLNSRRHMFRYPQRQRDRRTGRQTGRHWRLLLQWLPSARQTHKVQALFVHSAAFCSTAQTIIWFMSFPRLCT